MPKQVVSPVPPTVNIIAKGSTFEGTLVTESDIRVSGTIDGTIKGSTRVIVSEGGCVTGDIQANSSTIAGTVKGKVVVVESLLLQSTARVEGSIETGRLIIEEGAVFNGECQMSNDGQSIPRSSKTTDTASKGV